MKILKTVIVGLLVLTLMFGIFGCSGDTLATVNGTPITQNEFTTQFNRSLSYYGLQEDELEDYFLEQYGDTDYAVAMANSYRDSFLDELITETIMLQKAEELGLDQLTDEEIATCKETAAQDLEDYKSYYQSVAEEEASSDPTIDVDERANELYMNFMQSVGLTQTLAEEMEINNTVLQKTYQYYLDQCEITEEDYEAYYDEALETQMAQDEEDPDTALYYYYNYGYDVNVYKPSKMDTDVKIVKHILIAIDDDTQTEIYNLQSEGDDEGAEELKEEALAEIKEDAEEILAKLDEGEDFEELMEKYSDDYQEDSDNTYEVYPDGNFDENFLEAALKLKEVGDYTDLVESTYGYHIILFYEQPESGPIPYEDVKDQIIPIVEENKQSEYWYNLLDEWLEEADVTRISFLSEEDETKIDEGPTTDDTESSDDTETGETTE